jgi:Ca2+-binding EF-hand superfamily protein
MTKLSIALSILAGLAVVPTAALAMEPYLPKSAKSFAKLDSDNNGKITMGELQPRAEQRFLKLDGDKNSEVSSAEIDAALNRALENRRNRVLKAMDADTSGSISKAELDQFISAMMNSADADKDGSVTFEEAKKYRVAKLRKPATGEGAN